MDPVNNHYLFLIKSDTWGGAERRMAGYCSAVDYSSCRITWAVLKNRFSARFAARGMPVRVVEFPPEDAEGDPLKRLLHFYRFIRKQRPRVIIASNFWLGNYSIFEVLIMMAVTGGKAFMIAHDRPFLPPRPPGKMHWGFLPGMALSWRINTRVRKLISRVPCPVLAISEPVKQHLVDYFNFPEHKIRTLRSGVDLKVFKPSPENRDAVRRRYHIGERDTVIVSTARLHKVKRLERLLEAFAVSAKERDDLRLIIVGEGDQYGFLSAFAGSFDARIWKRIIFAGFADDVAPFLQAADIFVLPSETEGFSNACIEAMACGLAVVATRCGGPEAYIANGINGFLVENSAQGVTEGVRKAVCLDDTQRMMIAASARAYVEKNFDRAGGIDEFLSLTGLPQAKRVEITVPKPAVASEHVENDALSAS